MQAFLSVALTIYLIFYAFEGAIRHGFWLLGHDELIFIRDIILFSALSLVFIQQASRHKIHPAFIVYVFVVLLHGFVMWANIGAYQAAGYSAKVLLAMVAGAVGASYFFQPTKRTLVFFFLLWTLTFTGVVLDKYFVEMPWIGTTTTIGDLQVDISRDWEISGEDKRAGGFTRSSINAAMITPLVALILLFNMRGFFVRAIIAFATVPVLYWTTQKGAIIAYALVLGMIFIMPRRPIWSLRMGLLFAMLMCIILPIVLPGYNMPHDSGGVFSFSSFVMRAEDMWPRAWEWINKHDAFPFGVGLGGIGGAQRLYARDFFNAADNIYILLHAYFGYMTFIYMGWIAIASLRLRHDGTSSGGHAIATLVFLFAYGCVLSIIEDQMGAMFMGAAMSWLGHEVQRQKQERILKVEKESGVIIENGVPIALN